FVGSLSLGGFFMLLVCGGFWFVCTQEWWPFGICFFNQLPLVFQGFQVAVRRLRCRYNHSERKNHTKFFAEPPPHWSKTIPHRLNPSLHQLLKTNHPLLFVFYLPLSTESLPLHL